MTRILAILAALSAGAQAQIIGEINVYGVHKMSPERFLGALGLKAGSPLPPSKGELEDTLEKLPGIVQAHVEAVCCEGTRVILFIGIEERGAPHTAFHSSPAGAAVLPDDLVDAYRSYVADVERLAARGSADEDLSSGQSRMSDPDARRFQDRFASYAEGHVALLREVLRNGSQAEQRAVAAVVIGYVPRKQDVVNDLQYALEDPDESVRANAARALKAFAVLAARQPASGIRISPTWFVELLHSVILSDRMQATSALLVLTDREDASTLQLIRERGLDELVEMARWPTPRYAVRPFLLLGRVAGIPDEEVQKSWEKGDRDSVIERALALAGRKHG